MAIRNQPKSDPGYKLRDGKNLSPPPCASQALLAGRLCCLLRILKILVLEDIRRRAHQSEADAFGAGITGWKSVTAEHDHFMGCTMRVIMEHFINSGLHNRLPRAVGPAVA